MKYWAGLILFAIGGWLIVAARAHAQRALAAAETTPSNAVAVGPTKAYAELTVIGEAMTPIIIAALVILGAKLCLAFMVLDNGTFFSWFDMGGLLFVMVGYGTWLHLKTKYRQFRNS